MAALVCLLLMADPNKKRISLSRKRVASPPAAAATATATAATPTLNASITHTHVPAARAHGALAGEQGAPAQTNVGEQVGEHAAPAQREAKRLHLAPPHTTSDPSSLKSPGSSSAAHNSESAVLSSSPSAKPQPEFATELEQRRHAAAMRALGFLWQAS